MMSIGRMGLAVLVAAAGVLGGWAPVGRVAVAQTAAGVRVVIDGRRLETSPPPVLVDGRTLVPLRALFEALGAAVEWDERTRTVTAARGDRRVRVRIGQRLACLSTGCMEAVLLDVPPQIRGDRTFVPVRFAAAALGASVRWDGATRTVYVETGRDGRGDAPARAVTITSIGSQAITGPTVLRIAVTGTLPAGAAEVRYLLLDPETGRGPVVARGADVTGTYGWLPDPAHEGLRLLAAAVHDGSGRFLAGDVVPVRVAVRPEVSLAGVSPGQRVDGPMAMSVRLNFVATHVRYELVDPETGAVANLGDGDPEGAFRWVPGYTDNGPRVLRATAYDRLGRGYTSPPVSVVVAVPRRLALTGLSDGQVIVRPVTLGVDANFPLREVRYVLRDPEAGVEATLAQRSGAVRYRWLPAPEQAGRREVLVAVVDGEGREHRSAAVPVEVRGDPALFLETVGPNQVLAGKVELRSLANVPLTRVEYQLVDARTGRSRTVAAGTDAGATVAWTPAGGDAGSWSLRAVGTTPAGERVASEAVPVRVHVGPLYGLRPVMEKERFLGFASGLAVASRDRTGMSAALQVAQAILESGWGQSAPVDRYTGRDSYNLFGIKGEGPAGSVTSATWEEYNGVVYRVDAAFRAYRDPTESWEDHKRLLLTAERYGPFRAVMHDAVRGAWALRRAGYATDSRYPLKLIELMKEYDLYALDEVAP